MYNEGITGVREIKTRSFDNGSVKSDVGSLFSESVLFFKYADLKDH